MAEDADTLKPFMKLRPQERAAALGHWIYVETARSEDGKWPLRVAESWSDLNPAPKEFNMLTIETWSKHPKLLQAWIDAVIAHRENGERDPKD
jgi:hypothetical protein